MSLVNTYSLKKDIIITLCSDNYVRVLKKHYNDRFAIESLYAVSKTQGIVLLLFKKANTIENASDLMSKLCNIEITSARDIVLTIIDRYSIEMLFSSHTQKKYFRQDCMAGMSGIVIQVDGSYAYCGQSFNKELRFLNVGSVDLLSAWNSSELKALVSPRREDFVNTRCYECNDFDRCSVKRCYIRTYNRFGTIYDIDPLCPHYDE